jgi:hypothetical protein
MTGPTEDDKLRAAIVGLKERGKLPEKAELERALEETAKCAKCGGGVRVLIDEVHRGQSVMYDLEFLVALRCRDAACAWTARQWRPWTQARPLEL